MQHFVLVSEPKINLNFYKYNAITITRIVSSSNLIKFYAYYFGNFDTLRKDFDQKNRLVLHTIINPNLHLVKRTSKIVNLLNVSETETYRINLAVISWDFIGKRRVFLKHNINVFIQILFIHIVLFITFYIKLVRK